MAQWKRTRLLIWGFWVRVPAGLRTFFEKNKTLLGIIEYYYYSKRLSESKVEKKNGYTGIKLIKEFIKNMYYTYGKEFNKKDN